MELKADFELPTVSPAPKIRTVPGLFKSPHTVGGGREGQQQDHAVCLCLTSAATAKQLPKAGFALVLVLTWEEFEGIRWEESLHWVPRQTDSQSVFLTSVKPMSFYEMVSKWKAGQLSPIRYPLCLTSRAPQNNLQSPFHPGLSVSASSGGWRDVAAKSISHLPDSQLASSGRPCQGPHRASLSGAPGPWDKWQSSRPGRARASVAISRSSFFLSLLKWKKSPLSCYFYH